MGAIMAKAMGNEVTIISTSNKKEELARQMGMDSYIVSKDLDSMKKSSNSLDIILDTIGADHEIEHYIDMLKKNGTFVVLGIVSKPFEVNSKIHETKMIVMCQRFCDLFLFGLIWQYSSNHKTYDIGRFKVIATYLQQ